MSTVYEEVVALKAKISNLEDRIAVAETAGRSEEYIIATKNELVATKNELVEMRKKENILLAKAMEIGTDDMFPDISSYFNY